MIADLLAEIEEELDKPFKIVWEGVIPGHEGTKTFNALTAGGWNLLVVEFPFEGTDEKGYEGTASKGGTIVRLPRPLAQHAFEKAKAHKPLDEVT